MPRYAATLNAVEKGLENVTPAAGVTLLDDWIEQLNGVDKPGVKALAGDLDRLKKELGKGDGANADAIHKLLGKLGEATVKAADAADGVNPDKLRQLGEALQSVGAKSDA